jgi:hypothetical protein
MKCPGCVKEGRVSKVFVNGLTRTLLSWMPYYDEDGKYHDHNPNRETRFFRCSNDHEWTTVELPACPTCGKRDPA